MLTTGGSAICCISPAGRGYRETGTEALSENKGSPAGSSAFREGPGDRACPGRRHGQGACGDAHFLGRQEAPQGIQGITDGFLYGGSH